MLGSAPKHTRARGREEAQVEESQLAGFSSTGLGSAMDGHPDAPGGRETQTRHLSPWQGCQPQGS